MHALNAQIPYRSLFPDFVFVFVFDFVFAPVAGVAVMASVQVLSRSLVAVVTARVACRLACAVAWLRIDPAIAFAPLSHTLMKGFFFNQGLRMSVSLGTVDAA